MIKLTTKKADQIISATYAKVANGVQVPIMKLGEIHAAGKRALVEGLTAGKGPIELRIDVETAIKAAVDAVRQP